MSVWTFLDRNGEGLFFLTVIILCFAFGTCGDGKGCRVHIGTDGCTTDRGALDGGAP